VITGAFDASRFEMAIILVVSVALAVCTGAISRLCLGGSDLIHCCRYSTRNVSLLLGAGLSSTNNTITGAWCGTV
jgi:hypothetical protein